MLYDAGDSLTASHEDLWEPIPLSPGKPFNRPEALFRKLDASIVEEERARLGK
jgi:methionyl-tRNA synthetase